MDTIAERLQYLVDIKNNGKSGPFAREAGVSPATFHNYLKGRMPSSEALINIRRCYGVNLDWLLSGEGDTFIQEKEEPESLAIEVEVLQGIINWVETRLAKEKKRMEPDKKARFIALAYEYFTQPDEEDESGKQVNDKAMGQLFKLVV